MLNRDAWHVPPEHSGEWAWYLIPCPDTTEYKAALIGAVFLLTQADNWDVDTGNILEPVMAFSEAFNCMSDVTVLFDRIADALEVSNLRSSEVVAELAGIKDALYDAEGGGLADLITLLPVLLGQSNTTALAMLGEVQSGRLDSANVPVSSGSSECCNNEPMSVANAVANGYAQRMPLQECNASTVVLEYSQPIAEVDMVVDGNVWEARKGAESSGAYPVALTWVAQASVPVSVTGEVRNNDSGQLVILSITDSGGVPIASYGDTSFVDVDVQFDAVEGEQYTFITLWDTSGISQGGSMGFVDLQVCFTGSVDESLPVVALALNEGIGEVTEGSLFRSWRGWVEAEYGLTNTEIELEIVDDTRPVFTLDWTRPYSGTLQLQSYMAGNPVELLTIPPETEDARWTTKFSQAFDRVVLSLKMQGGQALADIVIWAFADD